MTGDKRKGGVEMVRFGAQKQSNQYWRDPSCALIGWFVAMLCGVPLVYFCSGNVSTQRSNCEIDAFPGELSATH